jgi:serine/threonine protein kinase
VPDILAIVSKAIFERDARVDGELVGPGDVWPVDRYNSTHKTFEALEGGGRIFLVTVRPPNEQLWFVGVVDQPEFDGKAWIAPEANAYPVTDITPLRKTIVFESGKGMSQDRGTLGMSLQTPRALTEEDAEQILDAIDGDFPDEVEAPPRRSADKPAKPAKKKAPKKKAKAPEPARIIDGKYEVLRQLGRGGMGVVYEARHTGTHRHVALKEIIGSDLAKERKAIERFHREARATGAIDSRHIAKVLDTGTDPDTGNPFLVMELFTGEDVQNLLDRVGTLDEPVALEIVVQACTGLAKAHAAGVIHRDIKPANLFLARRDDEVVVTLLDFGVARVKQELATESFTLTSTGLMLGTPLYMSPEQVVGAKDLDHRTDLWALGVVLYELLAGTTPYTDHETLGALLVSICSKPAKPLREVAPKASARVEAICAKALALDPVKRYQTAEELLEDLGAARGARVALGPALAKPHGKSANKEAFLATSPSQPDD